jgi:crotonobetainyl-CoA:carnitine CoA-transferase CaiB-like acyl-CoA transferase
MRPLAGLRIIDLTVAIAGPVATSLLADLGAEVIRVEPPFPRPLHVDIVPRMTGAPDRPYNRILSYNDLHRAKRAVTLDLSKTAGRDVLLRLVGVSDIVVENMSPRVLPSLGLGYDALRAVKPDIVLASMPAFGATGPLRDRVSFGPGIDAMSGLAHLTGYPDRGPMQPANYYCDYNAGALAAFAVIAAIRHRDRTGEGQHIELAMLEGELQVVGEALLDYTMNGRVQHRTGNAHPSMAPHGVYQCAGDDRWIAIACEDDAQWQCLCSVIGRSAFAMHPRFADVISRIHHRAEIDEIVSAWTRARPPHEAAELFQAAGVPAGPVQLVTELLDDPQLRAREYVTIVPHPEAGATPYARPAFTLSKTPTHTERHAPLYGQDTDYVLRELLGLSAEEVAALEAAGVTARSPL